ncbi:sodium:solute symporter family protein [bacterium]|nr:sodium:solute symporter family protein [bacterium]
MHWDYFLYLFIYFVLLLGVGSLFSPKMKNLEDFFLASRRLPASLVYLSVMASWLGATSTLVSVDEAYAQGISSFWVMGMPAVVTVLLFAVFLADPIRRLPIITLPDLVEMRYGRTVRHMASLVIVWYMILLASSQMVALGQFLKLFCGMPYLYSLMIGTGVVLVYSVLGGFFSVVLTDSLQFFFLGGGLLGLFVYFLGSVPVLHLPDQVSQAGKEGYFNFFLDVDKNLLIVLSFTLAWLISPIVWQRIQSAQSAKKARKGLWAASGTFFLVYWCVVFAGMFALFLFPLGEIKGPLLSALISTKLGKVLGGILFVAIVAAVMSTMDTAINTGAMSLTRDVFEKIILGRRLKHPVGASRGATVLMGALAFLIAAQLESILKALGLASEIMAEGLFIPGMAMIFLKKRRKMAGLLSLGFGGGYSVFGFLCQLGILPFDFPSWPYSVPYGVGLCLGGFLLGWWVDTRGGMK